MAKRIKSAPAGSLRDRGRIALRAAGLKCTEHRLAVLLELEQADAPLSHREMLDRLADYRWDPATTFRNLNDLCEAGLVLRIDVGDHVWRFELNEQAARRKAGHPHFLCVACGAVTCLRAVSTADALQRLRIPDNVRTVYEVLLKGRCANCETQDR